MIEHALLGAVQGLLEWLPVSSEGFVVLAAQALSFPNALQMALFLHLGTMLAVIAYFHKKIHALVSKPGKQGKFIAVATLVSLPVALPLYFFIKSLETVSVAIVGVTGLALLATGFLVKKRAKKAATQAFSNKDAVYLGFLQGLAIIPGLSRSGITMFGFLSKGYDQEKALKTSFLMSVPVSLAAGLLELFQGASFQTPYLLALTTSFLLGLASMHFLLKLARKLDFSWFCWFFGVLALASLIVFF
jgi:undecaprenyl-diphosphatase